MCEYTKNCEELRKALKLHAAQMQIKNIKALKMDKKDSKAEETKIE